MRATPHPTVLAALLVLACATAASAQSRTLTVSPDTATLSAPGATVQLTATVVDRNGRPVSASGVAWSSLAAAVATVDAAGRVTARAAGSARIVATWRSAADTATVTVQGTVTAEPAPAPEPAPEPAPAPAPAPSGGLTNECAVPSVGWIWCDDFDQDRLSRYFEVQTASGSFARTAGAGAEGSYGMRARWTVGQVSAGALHLAFGRTPSTYFRPVDAGTANHRDVYWRVYVRPEPGWTGGGGYKLSRATVFATSGWAQAMIAHHWSGGSGTEVLIVDPASGTDEAGNLRTTGYNDNANLRWLGAVRGTIPVFGAAGVGQWHCVETHVRLNDAGQANGVFESWINGTADARKTGINWLGSYSQYGINAVFLENYWNGGAPQAVSRVFDNFVVSTQRIGCK